MSERRTLHDKLFRVVVVMGAALGTAACYEHGKSPPGPPDAKVATNDGGPRDGGIDAVPVDVIVIL